MLHNEKEKISNFFLNKEKHVVMITTANLIFKTCFDFNKEKYYYYIRSGRDEVTQNRVKTI